MTDSQSRPFDERAALAELERLADKIQATRKQRERAVAEFNAFVKTFKDEDHAARWKALEPAPRAEAIVPPQPKPLPPAGVERRAPEPIVATSAAAVTAEREPEPIAWSAPQKRTSADVAALINTPRGRITLAAAVLITVLLVSWLWSGTRGVPPAARGPEPAASTPAPPPVQPAASGAPAEPKPVASTGPRRPINIVLMTSRPVWTRVIVDDQKVIERELPGSQTINLAADRAIVVRAGDAGAIRVVVNGKDQGVLGRDGQIASRAFTAKQ